MDKALILGTANFGNSYGISGGLDKQQCFDILDAAWDMNIRWLDTARSYGDSEKIIGSHGRGFKIISKGDGRQDKEESEQLLRGYNKYLKHHYSIFSVVDFDGISVYSPDQVEGYENKIINFPLNLFDQQFSNSKTLESSPCRITRSIFIQGQVFNMPDIIGIPFYHLCWNFVINHPNCDMICFGVDSVKQLEDIMKIPQYSIQYDKTGTGDQWIKSIA